VIDRHCKSCRFWNERLVKGWGACFMLPESKEVQFDANLRDGEWIGITVVTKETFGCNLHEYPGEYHSKGGGGK
jgi:hypothetical protein